MLSTFDVYDESGRPVGTLTIPETEAKAIAATFAHVSIKPRVVQGAHRPTELHSFIIGIFNTE